MTTLTACRASGSSDLRTILDFGASPLSERLLGPDDLETVDPVSPLRLVFCPESALVQITENVSLEILYKDDYPYYTSVSPALVRHFTKAAHEIIARTSLEPGSFIVEAASNDGHQLKVFRDLGHDVLGIDPAEGPVKVANDDGVETLCRFFDVATVEDILAARRQADLLTGNNVLNLFQDLDDFARAADALIAEDGVIVLEVPYFVDTIDNAAFDNVFHQNTTYWTATSLDRFFRRNGFHLNDVQRISTFGGSLRAFISRTDSPTEDLQELLAAEQARGVDTFEFYAEFAGRVEQIKLELMNMVAKFHADGKRIVAYGAAGGMATTLLSYTGLDHSLIDYAVDINPHKHGQYTSGSRLMIQGPDVLAEDVPDYALLLAWNHADEIMAQQSTYRSKGGRFIIPVPVPRIV